MNVTSGFNPTRLHLAWEGFRCFVGMASCPYQMTWGKARLRYKAYASLLWRHIHDEIDRPNGQFVKLYQSMIYQAYALQRPPLYFINRDMSGFRPFAHRQFHLESIGEVLALLVASPKKGRAYAGNEDPNPTTFCTLEKSITRRIKYAVRSGVFQSSMAKKLFGNKIEIASERAQLMGCLNCVDEEDLDKHIVSSTLPFWNGSPDMIFQWGDDEDDIEIDATVVDALKKIQSNV